MGVISLPFTTVVVGIVVVGPLVDVPDVAVEVDRDGPVSVVVARN